MGRTGPTRVRLRTCPTYPEVNNEPNSQLIFIADRRYRFDVSTQTTDTVGTEQSTGGLTDSQIVGLWGAIVGLGWIVSQALGVTGVPGVDTATAIVAVWLIGSLIPIGASFYWMRTNGFTGLFTAWTVLGVTGIGLSFAVAFGVLGVGSTLIYGSLWFAGPAVGFLVTSSYMTDWSGRLYAGTAVANLAGAAAVLVVPGFTTVYFAVAALIQGGPMLYHSTKL